MRDQATEPPMFRLALKDLSRMLVYEALRAAPTKESIVETPLGPATVVSPARPPIVIPVLRAGLGMLDGAQELVPDAPVAFIGAKRDEATFKPETYLNSLPSDCEGQDLLVVDPMLATGGSAIAACELARGHNVGRIIAVTALAAPEGVEALRSSGLVELLVTAAIDDHLNDNAYIVPGLGDAGDRQFGIFE